MGIACARQRARIASRAASIRLSCRLPFRRNASMIQRIDAGPRMSEASIHNGVVYLAGQVPETDGADIETQTREVLEAIDALLAQAGSDKRRILRAQIYLADIADFAGMNRAWDAWVVGGDAPSRATVEAKLARPEWKVEIVVTAAV
jgi:enamine deaminase RidA (YjgF/YER057c/UK114 family)